MISFKIARSESELNAAYALRYHVFGEIHGYLKGWEEYERKIEWDTFDENGQAISFIALDCERVIGTVRLIPKITSMLKIQDYIDFPAEVRWCEASRLCVLPEYRGGNGGRDGIRVVDGLCKMYFTYAINNGMSKIAVLANVNKLHEGKAQKTHGRMGFVRAGEEFFLEEFSEFAVPMVADLERIPKDFRQILAENWSCIERPYNLCLFPDLNIKDFWNDFADSCYDDYLNVRHYQELLDLVSELSVDAKSIADIGCGSGNFIQRIVKSHPREKIIGVDISESMLDLAQKKTLNPTIEYYHGDAKRIPLPDKCVDTALAVNLLFQFEKPDVVLRELQRISRKYIIVTGPLHGHDVVDSFKSQTDGDETSALNYNRIFIQRNGVKFQPNAFQLVMLCSSLGMDLVRYEQAYDGLLFVAKFQSLLCS